MLSDLNEQRPAKWKSVIIDTLLLQGYTHPFEWLLVGIKTCDDPATANMIRSYNKSIFSQYEKNDFVSMFASIKV